jgi:hypothetical protein
MASTKLRSLLSEKRAISGPMVPKRPLRFH